MRKEIMLAVVFGVLVALVVSVVVYQGQRQSAMPTEVEPPQAASAMPVLDVDDAKIKVTYPVDGEVYSDKVVNITGKAWADALVAVFVNDKQELVSANGLGEFSLETNLESGSNVVTVRGLDGENVEWSDRVTVIYSNKNLEETLVSESELEGEAQ